MSRSSMPVAIPITKSKQHRRDSHALMESDPYSSLPTSVDCTSDLECATSLSTPLSSTTAWNRCLKDYPVGKQTLSDSVVDSDQTVPPSPLTMSRSSSIQSSLSAPSSVCTSPSLRLCRALSPPREEVTANDPLHSLDDDPDNSDSDTDLQVAIPLPPSPFSEEPVKEFIPSKKPPRRKSQFKSSLTASLIALRDKIPSSIPTPTLYSPQLLQCSHQIEIDTQTTIRQTISSSLPVFAISDQEEPPSSAVQLQTYSVSLGPPRKPREARMNSDFLRLLALVNGDAKKRQIRTPHRD